MTDSPCDKIHPLAHPLLYIAINVEQIVGLFLVGGTTTYKRVHGIGPAGGICGFSYFPLHIYFPTCCGAALARG